MCGIAGFLGKGDTQTLLRMAATLSHRGPDDSGTWLQNEVGLAHARLSIIDLSPLGHQPMQGSRSVISFNGEIYNYKELRSELEEQGVTFTSKSDTEVILRLYEAYGTEAFQKLQGMFAFALYDTKEESLYLVRDRAGEKPLYYYQAPGVFLFSSEPKALFAHPEFKKEINPMGLSSYLLHDAALTPESVWQGVRKLPPSHFAIVKNKHVTLKSYWQPPSVRTMLFKEAKASLDQALEGAVSSQLIADVPVGVFLSGGLDSSLVAYYASRVQKDLHTFSLGFEESSYDESSYAKQVAAHLGTTHHELTVSAKEVRDVLPTIISELDEPLADPALLPQYLLSKFTREHVKVALSGDGGDELFLGYPTFTASKALSYYVRTPALMRRGVESLSHMLPVSHKYLSFDFKLRQFLRGAHDPAHAHSLWLGSFTPEEEIILLTEKYRDAAEALELPESTDESLLYFRTYLLDVLLMKADRASMYTSLEVRAPLLHAPVLDLAFSMPAHFKHKGMTGKYILRSLMQERLPREIVWRGKHGFGLPVGQWFKDEWKELLLDTLSTSNLTRAGFCEPQVVERLIDEHLSGSKNNRKQLYNLLILHLWYAKFVR